jgi:hypothetical protein
MLQIIILCKVEFERKLRIITSTTKREGGLMIKHSQIEDVRENLEDIEHEHYTMINNRIIKNEKIKLFLNKNYIFS